MIETAVFEAQQVTARSEFRMPTVSRAEYIYNLPFPDSISGVELSMDLQDTLINYPSTSSQDIRLFTSPVVGTALDFHSSPLLPMEYLPIRANKLEATEPEQEI